MLVSNMNNDLKKQFIDAKIFFKCILFVQQYVMFSSSNN